MGYSTSCSLCIASLQYGWKEVLAQKIEKASGFLGWKDKGMQLSKRLLGKRCIMKHHPSLGLPRTADALQRPPLIPPAQKSAPDNMQDIQTHCNRENVFPFSCLAMKNILIPETVLISLQMDLRLFVTISKLCFKKKRRERVKRDLRMQIYLKAYH